MYIYALKIWAASANCLAPAVMRALFRTALCELSLMNIARAYGRVGNWRWCKNRWGGVFKVGGYVIVLGGCMLVVRDSNSTLKLM